MTINPISCKRVCFYAALIYSLLNVFSLSAQITGSNNTTVVGNGTDPQNVSTNITMPTGVLSSGADLTITFRAAHTWVGDVTATLNTPCGSTDLFARPNAGTGSNGTDLTSGGNYSFNTSSTLNFPSSSGGVVTYNTYIPNYSGLSFPCSDISGTWTLTLSTNSGDHARVLTLNSWSISIIQTPINYFDSDGDGVVDNIDIDDDNDGILDTVECDMIVNPPLMNPDFEGIDILTLDSGATDVVPTTGIWKGDASHIPNWLSADPTNNHLEIWHNTQAASNDVGGQAYEGEHWAEVNATTNDGLYQDVVSTPGDVLQWSFAHRKRTSYIGSATEDTVRLLIGDPNGTLTSQGDYVSAADASWTLHFGTYTVPPGQTTTRLTFTVVSIASGQTTSGNFIDNVELYVVPSDCQDTDGDAIPDYFDLDSDNDGIPDIVEAGFGNVSQGKAQIPLSSFIDTNNNGMHDAFENSTPLDSDGDGVPNFLDLDSDNDSIFDVDESGAGNASNSNFDNGDGDIDGDGVGDGPDSDAVRKSDENLDGILEYFSDGILDVYDYFNGSTMTTAYGNNNQGLGNTYYVIDSDSDGLPDYIDLTSNGSSFDISNTLFANLDTNNDGKIDGSTDADEDGILDLFDTNDNSFGSPRDLDQKLQLYFDGRNDYIQDNSLTSGWSDITLMGWVKIDPTGSGIRTLFGQDNFYLRLHSSGIVSIEASGTSTNYSTTLPENQWVHIGATYSKTSTKLKLFVNGERVNAVTKSGNLNTDSNPFVIGKRSSLNSQYFKGFIDEVRLFNIELTESEFQKIIYQEIENNGNVRGTEIPRDVSTLPWANLVKYYRFDRYKGDITDDLTTATVDIGTGAKLYNIKVIQPQSAPMPFVTQLGNVSLSSAVHVPSAGINGNDVVTYDWSIVRVEHDDITHSETQRHTGLIINEEDSASNAIEYHVTDDSELNVSWYLKLDGFIDLEGESQLVQGEDSMLDPTSKGKIERDQQGTADTFTYNYWSSPVSLINSVSNNRDFSVKDVFKDGSNAANPQNINWRSSGYDGTNTSPVGIADYWIWKFNNYLSNDYASWQHLRSTGLISPGEGFTMKGPGTGPISSEQNYVFDGKPNNGDINLTINAGNDYLIGNPYPSAIDARQFIIDNGGVLNYDPNATDPASVPDTTPTISGTLYFWEHWGGGSHILSEYQGGYAIYNFSGAVAAPSYGTNDPDVATGGTPTKIPGRYIPVGQGFFVVGENTGTIQFNNGQRVFKKEGSASSVYMRNTNVSTSQNNDSDEDDTRMKFRIGFNSINTIHRQLLLTIDSLATPNFDHGFDAILYDALIDDMYWMIEGGKYSIQGQNEIDENTVIPIGLHTETNGINEITIDALENVPTDIDIYLHDKVTDTYHDLRNSSYFVNLNAGEYLARFELTFGIPELLSQQDIDFNSLNFYYALDRKKIVVLNQNYIDISKIEVYNINGQSVYENNSPRSGSYNEYDLHNLSSGTYIIKLNTASGSISTKKVLVK